MRKSILTAACALVLASTAAIAQHGPPGGFGGGMGAGPPMTPPGQMGGIGGPGGASGYASDIASQRGQFGRDFAAQQQLTAQQYQQQAAQHRADAMVLAQAARAGRVPANAVLASEKHSSRTSTLGGISSRSTVARGRRCVINGCSIATA